MNKTHDKYMIENRIESLKKIMNESGKTVMSLDMIIAGYIVTRDNEVKKKESLQKTINKLNIKLDKLK